MDEVDQFRITSGIMDLTSLTDPKISLLDQFLKMTMDGLRASNLDLLALKNGSALEFMEMVVSDSVQQNEPEKRSYMPLLRLLLARIQEDRDLCTAYQSTDYTQKMGAAQQLRQRGLLR